MSPLIRSLLALAALLAAVSADCDEKEVGHETKNRVVFPTVHVKGPKDSVEPKNACAPGPVIGEDVKACSQIDGDECKPTIHLPGDQYTPIVVDCLCQGGCNVFITQFC